MRHPAAFAILIALAACVQPAPERLGEVRVATGTYPITTNAAGTWRVLIDGRSVLCARPTEESCYWAVRHYLTSQELLDDLG
jgi:hypothetical protein